MSRDIETLITKIEQLEIVRAKKEVKPILTKNVTKTKIVKLFGLLID